MIEGHGATPRRNAEKKLIREQLRGMTKEDREKDLQRWNEMYALKLREANEEKNPAKKADLLVEARHADWWIEVHKEFGTVVKN